MNLRDLVAELLPAGAWSFVKVGPRKSGTQPQVWFACQSSEPRAIVKFSGVHDRSEIANQKLHREAAFLKAVTSLDDSSQLREQIPTLIHHQDFGRGAVLVTDYCPRPHLAKPIALSFRRDPLSMRWWLESGIRFLALLQNSSQLHEALQIPTGQVVSHGDFSHYNALGSVPGPCVIIDWEDWGPAADLALDAWQLGVLVTIAEQSLDAARESFQRHWIRGSDYSKLFFDLADGLLPTEATARTRSLHDYLQQQSAQCSETPVLRELFDACRKDLSERGG
jgi:hypothetical protein